MAIIRPSAIVGAISGNLAGVNFATGKSGPYARQRRSTKHSLSARQVEIRAMMQIARHQWQNFDEPTRASWRQAAANRPHINRLGISSHLSGAALYIQQAMLGVNAPAPETKTGPFAFIPSFAAPPPLIFTDMVVVAGGNKIISFVEPQPDNNRKFIIYGAKTGSNKPLRSWNDFTLLANRNFSGGPTTPANVTQQWDNVIGDVQVGEQVFWKFIYGGSVTWPSAPGYASGFATA